jgi:hypothetical protein
MGLCLFPLFLGATRPLSLLQLAIPDITLFMLQLATLTMGSGVRIEMRLCSLPFWPSRTVSYPPLHSLVNVRSPASIVSRAETETQLFRDFKRQLFHTSVAKILSPLKPAMTTPEVVRCYDGHFRRVIYGVGPYIADYQEQVTVACIVQHWCAGHVHSLFDWPGANVIFKVVLQM